MNYVWKEIETEEEFLETFRSGERLDIIPRTSVARDFSRPCKKRATTQVRGGRSTGLKGETVISFKQGI